VKLTKAVIFGVGYILGARAGRDRYAQIVALMEKASGQLEEFSSRHPPHGQDDRSGRRRRGS
jgi:hypothetical protein